MIRMYCDIGADRIYHVVGFCVNLQGLKILKYAFAVCNLLKRVLSNDSSLLKLRIKILKLDIDTFDEPSLCMDEKLPALPLDYDARPFNVVKLTINGSNKLQEMILLNKSYSWCKLLVFMVDNSCFCKNNYLTTIRILNSG